MKSDQFRNLMFGPISEAGAVNDNTLRAWIRNNGLILGDRHQREEGRPRYDLADVARILMMDRLIGRHGLQAQRAVNLVNASASRLELVKEDVLAAMDDPASEPLAGDYIVVIEASVYDVDRGFDFTTKEDLLRSTDGLLSYHVIDLPAYVLLAKTMLGNVLSVRRVTAGSVDQVVSAA